MADSFIAGDMRRVKAVFKAALPAPFTADVTLVSDYMGIFVSITDPDDEKFPVAQCLFEYEAPPKNPDRNYVPRVQPNPLEVEAIAAQFKTVCLQFPKLKAEQLAKTKRDAAIKLQKDASIAAEIEEREKQRLAAEEKEADDAETAGADAAE